MTDTIFVVKQTQEKHENKGKKLLLGWDEIKELQM